MGVWHWQWQAREVCPPVLCLSTGTKSFFHIVSYILYTPTCYIFSWHAPFFLCSFTWALVPVPRNFSDYPGLSNLGITVLWYFFIGSFAIWLSHLIYPFDCSIGQKIQTIPSKQSWWKSLLLYKADIHIVLFTKLCFQLQLTSARRCLQILNGLGQRKKNLGTGATR